MKVLQVINSLNTGGAEKLVLESIMRYNKKGFVVDLLLLNGDEYPFLKELKEYECCTVFSLGNGSVYNPLLIFKIIPFLKKYDLLHVHLFPSLYWVAIAKLISFSKKKIIYTEHNTNNKRRNSKIFKSIDKIIYGQYSKIITIAEEVDINLKKHLGFSKSRFELINNGVDTGQYKNAVPYSKTTFFSEKDILLIQVSSFRAQKDQPTLIKSLKKLPSNVKLLLVGDGPLRNDCENLVKKLKLEDCVKFLGIRMDVPKLLKTADIVVLSSHHEGLSLSSIEAMASGKPFVASNVQGLREVVEGAGILFAESKEDELAQQITNLMDDNDYYLETVKNCLNRAEKFTIDKMVVKYISLFKDVLKK